MFGEDNTYRYLTNACLPPPLYSPHSLLNMGLEALALSGPPGVPQKRDKGASWGGRPPEEVLLLLS